MTSTNPHRLDAMTRTTRPRRWTAEDRRLAGIALDSLRQARQRKGYPPFNPDNPTGRHPHR